MLETQYAPAARFDRNRVWEQYGYFASNSVLDSLLGKVDQYLLILNECRQIIYANKAFLNDFKFKDVGDVLGQRVGEALDCRFSSCSSGGCGTSGFCKDCGAVNSILKSLNKVDDISDCIILTRSFKALELCVSSKYMEINGEAFTIFSVSDISERKHLMAIEDVFYHDITNLASSMYSMIQLMHDNRINDKDKLHGQLMRTSAELISELNSHKLLKSAEKKELTAKLSLNNSIDLLKDSIGFVERMQSSRGNILYIDHNSAEFDVKTDTNLFNRVMINMLTNALEASGFGDKVTLGCAIATGEKTFWVHNNAYIAPEIQSKIFRVPFSTKKRGSGYGTTSMRIIAEAYLNGRVDFETSESSGTVFRLILK